jgi:hypothetical protein
MQIVAATPAWGVAAGREEQEGRMYQEQTHTPGQCWLKTIAYKYIFSSI